jgi:hypothetical protein
MRINTSMMMRIVVVDMAFVLVLGARALQISRAAMVDGASFLIPDLETSDVQLKGASRQGPA